LIVSHPESVNPADNTRESTNARRKPLLDIMFFR
jgi:hypothetical protein